MICHHAPYKAGKLTVFAADALGLCPVAIIRLVGTFIPVISQMAVHFHLQHLFDRAGQQVFQGVLDVLRRLNVILPEQTLDDVPFSLCHWFWFVNFFFSVCHNLRPPMIFCFIIENLFRILRFSFYRIFFILSPFSIEGWWLFFYQLSYLTLTFRPSLS